MKKILLSILVMFVLFSCQWVNSGDRSKVVEGVSMFLTTPDEKFLFSEQAVLADSSNDWQVIVIDQSVTYQTMDGFGYTLTGGSARLMHSMSAEKQQALLQQLFSSEGKGIGVSYLRLSIGASDLSDSVFTYNDMPAGVTDLSLEKFSLGPDLMHLIPVLQAIKAIQPDIQLMGSPWSAPAWMKDNGKMIGGSLKHEYFEEYARYLARYIGEMAAHGLKIDALTIQNEPLHPGNNPSMYMSADDQALFIKTHLGPLFEREGIDTKIIIYDHNADRIDYPIAILDDPEARKYVDGSAFHLYGGHVNDIGKVHEAHPDKHLYFTEQWIGGPANFAGDVQWHVENLIIGASRNWCRTVLEWNLAADSQYQPHTDQGGCSRCLGALTIEGDSVSLNPAYYIIAHASKFVRPGSVRIQSNMVDQLPNVAFLNPDGKVVLIVLNTSNETQGFQVETESKTFSTKLEAGAVATYVIETSGK
ncbi:MAG: hypothetical protein JXR22_11250 [Prolixibacteraceae bacterium]|nr:hypothetical protein [Prolixibacteraceae bacterium]